MSLDNDLFLVTKETPVVSAVSSAVGLNGAWTNKSVFPNLQDLVGHLQHSPRAAAIVDIDPMRSHILSELDTLTRRFAEARFIVLSKTFNSDLVLQAMQAGARHFLVKDSITNELAGVVRKMTTDDSDSRKSVGTAITVLSAGGGCGATTISVNLAHELHSLSGHPSLLIDLDDRYGATGSYLGIQGQYGISDILKHIGPVDPHLITSTACAYSPGMHVLLSPASTNFEHPLPLDFALLGAALQSARQAYPFVVIDAPRIPLQPTIELAQSSLFTLIVFQMNVKDLRVARSLQTALSDAHVPADHILLIANRYHRKRCLISLQEAERTLGSKNIICVESDFYSALRSCDYGKPLAEIAPRSALRKNLAALALRISKALTGIASQGVNN